MARTASGSLLLRTGQGSDERRQGEATKRMREKGRAREKTGEQESKWASMRASTHRKEKEWAGKGWGMPLREQQERERACGR